MALIICPECGGKVSDKAACCIHCGYPIKQETVNCMSYNLVMVKNPKREDRIKIIGTVRNIITDLSVKEAIDKTESAPSIILSGLREDNANLILNKMSDIDAVVIQPDTNHPIDARLNGIIDEKERGIKYIDNSPVVCPKCGSTQIVMQKVNYGLTLTLLGSNVVENICQKCGHRWRPGK